MTPQVEVKVDEYSVAVQEAWVELGEVEHSIVLNPRTPPARSDHLGLTLGLLAGLEKLLVRC